MRNQTLTGDNSPCTPPAAPLDRKVRVGSPVSLLAIVPHLLGFMPGKSLVVIGTEPPSGQVTLVLRYDLPDPPRPGDVRDITEHASQVLAAQHVGDVAVIGYGPAALVAPLADQFRLDAAIHGLRLTEVLRVQDRRYWSYLCAEPDCCPPEGTPFDLLADPAWTALTESGTRVLLDRDDLAKTVATLDGDAGAAARRATQRAEAKASKLTARVARTGRRGQARRLIAAAGISSVCSALASYRGGRPISDPDQIAWLTVVLRDLRVRDDAWARMDPQHRQPYIRLWTDLTTAARPGYVAAPACLLAFTAWQNGNGALANVALDRAMDDQPAYSMAQLLREVIGNGVPPSAARLPMTPEQVAASYDEIDEDR